MRIIILNEQQKSGEHHRSYPCGSPRPLLIKSFSFFLSHRAQFQTAVPKFD